MYQVGQDFFVLNSVADNQVSRGRVVTRKVSENCELDNDTCFTGIIDPRSIF